LKRERWDTYRVALRTQLNPNLLILSVRTRLEDPAFLQVASSAEGGAVVRLQACELYGGEEG